MKINKILLLLIFFLGLSLRFFHLGQIPAILNRDEAALAYNAHLIATSGQDEWQVSWPLTFKSFGDYKLPGYPYLLAFLFKFLPENDFVTRLPSALAGSCLIIVAFFFARDILKVKERSALLMALLVAITPVFFFYSRIAFEANVALFLFVLGLYFLLKDKANFVLASSLIFLAILTYNTPLLLLPFIIFILIYKIGFKKIKQWLGPVFLLSIIFLWAIINFYTLATQKSTITIFSDPGVWEQFALYRSNLSGFWQTIFGNKYVFYLQILWQNLLKSFSIKFLVEQGGSHPWHALPSFGHLFYSVYFLAIFMLIDFFGEIVIALQDGSFNKKHLILLYLTIVALAPSVVTVDSPHATRSLFFFFMLIALCTMFIDKLCRILSKKSKWFIVFFLSLLTIESFIYYQNYFLQYPKHQPESLFVDYKNLIQEARSQYNDEPVAVIDPGGYQYIITAWYLKLTNEQFFATMQYQSADNINFYYGERLLNYHFIKNLADKNEKEKIVLSQESGLVKYE